MLGRELSKEFVLGAGEQIKQLLSPQDEHDRNVVKKGLILYRQGSIYNVSTTSHTVSAKVQDVTSVQVELDLDDFVMSTCTCPAPSICRHRIAAFLYVYASVDRVGTFVDLWKEEKPIDDVLKHVQKASSLLKPEKEYEDSSLASWIAFFDREFESWYEQVSSPNQLFQSLFHHYYSALKKKAPKSPEMKQFFIVQASVTVFIKILQLINETKPTDYMLQHIIYPYIDQLSDNVAIAISEMKRYALPFALDPLLVDSVERFRELLFTSKHYQYERSNLYQLLWIELLRRDKFINIEREWLEEHLEDEKNKEPSYAVEMETALMHMDFLQSRDEHIFETMKKLTPAALPFTFHWVEDIMKKKNWKRMSAWMSYMMDNSTEYINSDLPFEEKRQVVRYMMQLIKQYSKATNDEKLFERACRNMLPLSYAEYHDFLLDKEQYRTWIELQTLLGFSIEEMDTYVLKDIEKSEPGVLLPLYVKTVKHEISMKTRENYKMAVRYLKRMKAQYKKLKREEVWENYILQLSDEHKRLRAFQEELKKGKLIHD
ncbi:SWIM zinc finger family protein [Metabacillus litoralis]|uniref:SWIM zinc finger family protein n=1 Tax=Metabacillus litoralis TaxID=152268 RepID=UPI0013CECEFC|nr:SWIM zinc finger family protein [Metabacillus litoralis]MCM3409906.1 SWIM zinc finger domain-containing protein [Metabacillus litoralis]